MKRPISGATLSCLSICLLFFVSCVPQETETEIEPVLEPVVPVETFNKPVQLPVQYQKPSYKIGIANHDILEEVAEDVIIKVGASIRSTQGPQPLWDILKRLAALKKMSISWASDVDQKILVDVDINANDDFFLAIDNLLRQVDYYHNVQDSTIIVNYKETRNFHIAMPYTKQVFETATGGNVLGSNDAAANIEGTIRLDSRGNEFDIWKNIKLNLDTIMDKWSARREFEDIGQDIESESTKEKARGYETSSEVDAKDDADFKKDREDGSLKGKKAGFGYYIIDQHLGIITVTAPRTILKKVEDYLTTLKSSIYKQVSIEAKIIEVHLDDHSSIGLNWNLLLSSLSVASGSYNFGESQTKNYTNGSYNNSDWTSGSDSSSTSSSDRNRTSDYTLDDGSGDVNNYTTGLTSAITNTATSALSSGISSATDIAKVITSSGAAAISLASFTFDSFLNAVKEQGQATILSNPKLSVLNGQPALITVGRNVTYVESIDSDVNNDTGTISYSVETARILSGVGMALTANILDDDQIILTLVPVTSELEEPIEYRDVGLGTVGLPVINVREMSTTVRIRDGEMLVIGGLISSAEEDSGTFVPGTSDLGFFKYLFGYEEKLSRKRELIILLKPRIIN